MKSPYLLRMNNLSEKINSLGEKEEYDFHLNKRIRLLKMKNKENVFNELSADTLISLYTIWAKDYNEILRAKQNIGECFDIELFEEETLIQ